MLKIENYIGGELIAHVSGKYLDNYNSATGEVYSLIPDSDETNRKHLSKRRKGLFLSGQKWAWSKNTMF